jgi:hypothetical protein
MPLCLDNFPMHAAYLAGTSAVVIGGPTASEVYGYPGQYHLRAPVNVIRLTAVSVPGLQIIMALPGGLIEETHFQEVTFGKRCANNTYKPTILCNRGSKRLLAET